MLGPPQMLQGIAFKELPAVLPLSALCTKVLYHKIINNTICAKSINSVKLIIQEILANDKGNQSRGPAADPGKN